MVGVVMLLLGATWLGVQLLGGVVALPVEDWPVRDANPQLYWQFVYLIPSLFIALGAFFLRYRVSSFAGLRRERVNCATFLLVFAGTSLVLGKLSGILL